MLPVEEQRKVEELSESEYFDFIVERKVQAKVGDLLKRQRWWISALGTIFLFVLGWYGKQTLVDIPKLGEEVTAVQKSLASTRDSLDLIYDDQRQHLERISHELQSELLRAENFGQKLIDFHDKQQSTQLAFMDLTNTLMGSDRERLSLMLQQLETQGKSLRQDFAAERSQVERSLHDTRTLRDAVRGQLDSLRHAHEQMEYATAMLEEKVSERIFVVEKGSRSSSARRYRMSEVPMPGSMDTLRVVFYDRRIAIEEAGKTATVSFSFSAGFRQSGQLDYVMRQGDSVTFINEVDPQQAYRVECVYIYLQRNPIVRIPDFAMFKIERISDTQHATAMRR